MRRREVKMEATQQGMGTSMLVGGRRGRLPPPAPRTCSASGSRPLTSVYAIQASAVCPALARRSVHRPTSLRSIVWRARGTDMSERPAHPSAVTQRRGLAALDPALPQWDDAMVRSLLIPIPLPIRAAGGAASGPGPRAAAAHRPASARAPGRMRNHGGNRSVPASCTILHPLSQHHRMRIVSCRLGEER